MSTNIRKEAVAHKPVLKDKVLEYLDPQPNQNFVDCTLGGAGHTKAILERTAPNGKVLGIEWDNETLEKAKQHLKTQKLQNRTVLVHGNFADIKEIAREQRFSPIHGILLDLGLSSFQLEESKRGFSFQGNEPLDMRFDTDNPTTAAKIVNLQSRQELEYILKTYGEEKFASSIARAIVESRSAKKEIKTTKQLVEIIESAVPGWYKRQRLHFATKTFQALRIAANNELQNIKAALEQAASILEPEGRIVVISFHSLEDRIGKQFFAGYSNSFELLSKKPIIPSSQEIKNNPRSRSAKLRAAKKIMNTTTS